MTKKTDNIKGKDNKDQPNQGYEKLAQELLKKPEFAGEDQEKIKYYLSLVDRAKAGEKFSKEFIQSVDQGFLKKVVDALPKPSGAPVVEEGESWDVKSSDVNTDSQDPLLACLVEVTRFYGRPFTGDSLKANLPLHSAGMTPTEFIRAADRVSYSSRVVRRGLDQINNLVLPAVLLLKNRGACLLVSLEGDKAQVILPESGEGTESISLSELNELYIGHAIYIKPVFKHSKQKDQKEQKHFGHWFWGTLRKFTATYSQVAFATIFVNILAIAASLFTLTVYDRIIPNVQNPSAFSTLKMLLFGMIILVIFDFILKILRGHFVDNAGKRADILLSARLFEHLLSLKMSSRPDSTGGFANKMREYDSLREFFTSATMIALIDLPFIFIFLIVIYFIGHEIVYAPIVAIPLVIILGLIIQYPLRKQIEKTQQDAHQKQGILVETIQGLETIKALGSEGLLQREWEKFVGQSAKSAQRTRFLSLLSVNSTMAIQQLLTVSVVTIGVFLVEQNKIQMGAIIACSILVGRTMAPISQIAGLLQRLNQSMNSLKSLNEVMKLPTERPEGREFLSRPVSQGRIEFKNVTFSYPDAAVPALNNVSFRIEPGERVAFLGSIGSGKSTVAKLLIGLYEPAEGSVLIDGTDVRQMDPADIRKGVGSVLQDVFLFHGTIRENIAMGAPYADDAMIIKAARMAGADEFISQHPHGYGMQIGEKGSNLSGGQRQVIALSRALLTNPPILMMDEPTSMMDMTSERQFVSRLKRSFKDKTLLIISHRPSIFQAVDRLIVIGQGEIRMDGPRDKVLEHARNEAMRQQQGPQEQTVQDANQGQKDVQQTPPASPANPAKQQQKQPASPPSPQRPAAQPSRTIPSQSVPSEAVSSYKASQQKDKEQSKRKNQFSYTKLK